MFAAKNELFTRPSGGYQISRSLRFNSADTTYLGRTPSTAGNRQIFTWSGWVKRSALTLANTLFGARNVGSNPYADFYFSNTNVFTCDFGPDASRVTGGTTAVFRDTSAWYHVVVAVDTTQATDTNRVKVYINNQLFTLSAYPAQNLSTDVNNTVAHQMGRRDGGDQFLNGYMTEVNFIDGQQLTPSSFGETNAQTGVWQPKAFSGTYGTNGFELNFSDNSNTTAATLGKDYSGNGNNWTPNNFSVTAGSGNDSMVDVPTPYGIDTGVGGTVRGNYATLNPLLALGTVPLVNGNLEATSTGSSNSTQSTIAVSSGKWYAEFVPSASSYPRIGVQDITETNSNMEGTVTISWGAASELFINGVNTGTVNNYTGGDIIGVAVDAGTRKVWLSKNGTWVNFGGSGADPATGTNPVGTLAGTNLIVIAIRSEACTIISNFGQRAFVYTAPSGYKALCTQNLPTPTIGATTATLANKYFDVSTYTGNGTTQTITNSGFQPDFLWIKDRSAAQGHSLTDAVRGSSLRLFSESTSAEDNLATSSFAGSGFNVSYTGGSGRTNQNGDAYVGWQWKANGSGSSNTAGSITSTVSANTTSGFSVVTYTGNATSTQTVGHGIGIAPSMVIVKARSAAEYWYVWAKALNDNNKYLFLNTNGTGGSSVNIWQNTAPTSTVFSLGNDAGTNGSGTTYVAYCFAPVAGYSAFGSYAGNSSSNGPFVFTGFRPRFIMIKITTASIGASGGWHMHDTSRSPYNVSGNALFADQAFSEADIGPTNYVIDIDSNGFKVRDSAAAINRTGDTYIFMAFAETPFKYSLAR